MRAESVREVACKNGVARLGISRVKPVEGGVAESQDGAVHVGENIRRARPLVEQRHFAKNISRAERGQDRLPAANHRPRPQFAAHDQIHGVARIALPHHHGVLH